MLFADAHHVEFETPSCAMVIPSISTPPAPQKVREQAGGMEDILLIEARDLEVVIEHAEISSESNIYTSQIAEIDEYGMLHDTSPHEAQLETSATSAPDMGHDIRFYIRRPKRSK